ncbi:phage portal protein [Limosilactobacillus vaginalis]|uniref:phage portal protein n=1 Tax=Limosilactobacillus vaginalis TaxID=1633 RepID=UPI0021B56B4B|nr:phage portal protein [Limosilactobacillus vaginalis]UXC68586.1 phage portal protein [Limosilactobacillus vaginalis]
MVLDTKELYARSLLKGKRWSPEANKAYVMPKDEFHTAFDSGNLQEMEQVVAYFVSRHYMIDSPRITKLQRYYLGDNDIHYWANDKKLRNRADNRIASGFAKFITNMRVGYMLGKPIQFKPDDNMADDDKVDQLLTDFNQANDEKYHEKVMKTNLSVTGRAYELLYAGEVTEDDNGNVQTPEIKMRAIDPATAFVVYDTSIDRHSLFGVRYYTVEYNSKQYSYIDVYTANTTYHFKNSEGLTSQSGNDYELINQEQTSFGTVPLTEFINNENRTGDWESKLDEIDAYDLAMSEMANSEEDFANAKLVLNGDLDFSDNEVEVKNADGSTMTNDDGQPVKVPKIDTKDPFLWLKPSVVPSANGSNTIIPSSAEYLTKQINEAGWQTFINQLSTDIHKDTNTPNTTDEAFSGQSSGVALMYKLFGEDQERSMQESLYTRGIMRRLRLLGNFWKKNLEIDSPDLMNSYTPHYTPNLPRNNADLVNMVVQIANSNLVSEDTLREMISQVTGVSADAEKERIDDEKQENEGPSQFDDAPLKGVNPVDLAEAQAKAKQQVPDAQPKTMNDLFSAMRQGQSDDKSDNNAKS